MEVFREMRRSHKAISGKECKELLLKSKRAVLALNGDGGYPYAIPINYIYDEDAEKIYFHGSKVGHKVDSLKNSDKICFTVYGDEVIKDEAWAPYLKSVVIFGRCRFMEGDEAFRCLRKMAMKYYPNEETVEEEIKESGRAVMMYEIEIEHISGKEIQEK